MSDTQLIRQIAMRASQNMRLGKGHVNPAYFETELRIVHYDVCKLRLEDLFQANDADFEHDIAGIHEYLDILDASFRNNWIPRFKA